MDFFKLFDFLIPKGEDATSLVKWRQKIAASSAFLWIAVVAVLPLLAFFLLETKAHADEIHEAIKEEITTIKGDISILVENDGERAIREKAREIREVREAILTLQTRACQSEGVLRTELNAQVGALRSDYMRLTGDEFPPTPCSDLLGQ